MEILQNPSEKIYKVYLELGKEEIKGLHCILRRNFLLAQLTFPWGIPHQSQGN